MARESSAEEVEQQYLACMGPELGRLFHELWKDVVWLHAKWRQYRVLVAGSPQRIDQLNAAGIGAVVVICFRCRYLTIV